MTDCSSSSITAQTDSSLQARSRQHRLREREREIAEKTRRNKAERPALLTHQVGLDGAQLRESSLTPAVCSGLHRLDWSCRVWLLFELNICSGEMGERELTNTKSFRTEIWKYYQAFTSPLIPIHTSSGRIIIESRRECWDWPSGSPWWHGSNLLLNPSLKTGRHFYELRIPWSLILFIWLWRHRYIINKQRSFIAESAGIILPCILFLISVHYSSALNPIQRAHHSETAPMGFKDVCLPKIMP